MRVGAHKASPRAQAKEVFTQLVGAPRLSYNCNNCEKRTVGPKYLETILKGQRDFHATISPLVVRRVFISQNSIVVCVSMCILTRALPNDQIHVGWEARELLTTLPSWKVKFHTRWLHLGLKLAK